MITIPVSGEPAVSLLAGGSVEGSVSGGTLTVKLPEKLPDATDTVVVVKTAK